MTAATTGDRLPLEMQKPARLLRHRGLGMQQRNWAHGQLWLMWPRAYNGFGVLSSRRTCQCDMAVRIRRVCCYQQFAIQRGRISSFGILDAFARLGFLSLEHMRCLGPIWTCKLQLFSTEGPEACWLGVAVAIEGLPRSSSAAACVSWHGFSATSRHFFFPAFFRDILRRLPLVVWQPLLSWLKAFRPWWSSSNLLP